ncbi:MAG: ATP-binding cassette domain-containing protein [Proteocatella sp.]
MIKVYNLSYSYPQKDLYNKISFVLEDGQHCAFIGSSGSGKSTLVDIIMDPEEYMFDGDLEINFNHKIGHVTQFFQLDKTKETTVFEFVGEEFIRLQKEMVSICDKMETASEIELEVLMQAYQKALDAFDAIGGDDFETNINNKLNLADLGNRKDLNVMELSGGEVKIIQVIKEMLTAPNLIIMDEPDVFLDFENLNSLRKLINAYKGTLLIITHNRYLLDHCFNKIIHLENMEIQEFDGSYVDYNFSLLQSKIERQELSLADDEEISRNDTLINKLRLISTENSNPSRGRALKARMKVQERLESNRIKAPFVDIKQPEISFDVKNKIEDTIAIEVENYNLSFEDTLLEAVSFEIRSTDKVALIGPNGTGKTTLLKDLFKNGSEGVRLNSDIELAYLSQNQGDILDESKTIVNEFFDLGFNSLNEISSYLSCYGFEEEGIHQKIGSLSGGEKNILQLAKIAHSKANMLLLDEPTSHLDTYAQIALENALREYKGAVLMISHDYYSIVNCMDYVLIIEDKNIRRMSMKKFRKMIYSSHFDKDYLELEQKKKAVETKIGSALQDNDVELAKALSEQLEELIALM